ncbi:MAG: molybdenum cofactor biosynthesis protein MoaE [Phycisphaerales bacterium]|nr:molybdenum cofactor biosynthesis protein MoaE [Phycisphaerales bacterium]
MSEVAVDILFTPGPVQYVPPPMISPGGGECAFLGRSRAEVHEKHGSLQLLRYTAYESMAGRILEALARDAVSQHGALFVRIHHSVGDVPIGEASVLVQVVTGHRAEAFAACRMLIDRLKAEAPIWKSEVWADGTTWSRGQNVPPEVYAEEEYAWEEGP